MGNKKPLVVLALAALLAFPGMALAAHYKSFNQTIALEAGGDLSFTTHKGSIRLTSWDRPEVQIEARIEAPEDVPAAYGRAVVEATRVDVYGGGRSVNIRSNYSDVPSQRNFPSSDWGWSESMTLPYVHYVVRAPKQMNLRIKDYKSEIEFYGVQGRVDLETYKGTVTARDLTGELRLETYKGRVDVRDIMGEAIVETYKGNIALQLNRMTGRSRLETYKGVIQVGLPQSQGFYLQTDVGKRADFVTDFDVRGTFGGSRRRSSERWSGSVNGGGPELHLKSERGEIRIKRM